MKLEDIIGMELTHKKFGKVPVVDLFIDYSNLASTKFKVKLNNRYALFSIDSLFKFFTDVPKDILEDIKEIINKSNNTDITDNNNKAKIELVYINSNEQGEELTINDWRRSKKFVVDFWWFSNGFLSPVVMDEEKIFISSKAACKYLGIQETKYYDIYMICNRINTSKKLKGHSWRFAKSKEIDEIIKNYEQ